MRVLTYFHASTAKFGSFGLLFVLSELINFDYAMHFKISSLLVYSCVCVCVSLFLSLAHGVEIKSTANACTNVFHVEISLHWHEAQVTELNNIQPAPHSYMII